MSPAWVPGIGLSRFRYPKPTGAGFHPHRRTIHCPASWPRWLRRRKIDPGQFLQAEPKAHQYRLGAGWNEKAALGGGEAHYTLGADAGDGGD